MAFIEDKQEITAPISQEDAAALVFDALAAAEEEEAAVESLQTDLGRVISRRFEEAKKARIDIEDRWVDNLRQYKGEYTDEQLANITSGRSTAFIRLTRNKTKTVDSRLFDFLSPANGSKNWDIIPTPIPSLNPAQMQQMAQAFVQQTQQQITEEALMQLVIKQAKEQSERMSRTIEDQLAEIDYRGILRAVLHSGNLYGTGVMKGPLTQIKTQHRYVRAQDGSWAAIDIEYLVPYVEYVPIWDFYPDMSATDMKNARYVIQRHVKTKADVLELATQPEFDAVAIEEYLDDKSVGDVDLESFETELKDMGDITSNTLGETEDRKYQLLEYWGYVDTDDLRQAGIDVGDSPSNATEIPYNIWVLGDKVIKAVPAFDGKNWPYFVYYYDKDETSIFGEGIAEILRDIQELMNAGFRGMLDNAAISAGPQIEVNLDLMSADEDVTDIRPFKVWTREGRGADAAQPALRVYTLPSYTAEFLRMNELFEQYGDTVTTIPRFMWGDAPQGGVGRTASGISMIMGNANITIKDQVKNFDDGITTPFISAMYRWNMEFSQDETIKGDYNIVARGTTSLIAKEVLAERLMQFYSITSNPVDMQFTNRHVILKGIAKVLDLADQDVVKPEQQVMMEQQQAQQAQEQERKFMTTVIEAAREQGVAPQALIDELKATYQMAAQVQQQQPQQG